MPPPSAPSSTDPNETPNHETPNHETPNHETPSHETEHHAPPADAEAIDDTVEVPPRVGPFRVRDRLASGGMGVVYEAEQENPRRSVALKVLRADMSTPDVVRRFEYETQILAQLRHPGIAQIYEAGTFELNGRTRPYYAMELVEGARPLGSYCDQANLDVKERLQLFAEICDAVHHGHQRGVIHRDLKPGNILVDGEGHPKIIDFGVARAVDSGREPTTSNTSIGQLLGTLQYMSPEQVGGDPTEVDIRSDVYALGVVLYELLTGSFPYDLSGRAIFEATQTIREEAPARPSTRVSTLRGDIETITLTSLEKEKDRRYATVHDFAEDVRRYLRGEAILARPPSLTYQLSMLARRYRTVALATMVIVLVTVTGFVITAWALLKSLDQQTRAEKERTRAIEAKADADLARRAAERSAYRAAIAAANAALRDRDLSSARHHINAAPVEHRGWEWRYLRAQTEPRQPALIGHGGPVARVAVTPDGKLIVSVDEHGEFLTWSLPDRRFVDTVDEARYHPGTPIAFLDDSHFMAATPGDYLGLFDSTARRLVTEHFRLGPTFNTYAMAANRETFAIASLNEVEVWRLGEESPHHRLPLIGEVAALAIDRTGTRLAARDKRARFWLWELSLGEPVLVTHETRRNLYSAAIAFDPTRDELAESAEDLSVRVRSSQTGRIVRRLIGHADVVTSLAYGPSGRWLATTSEDSTVRLWSAEDGLPGPVFIGHRGATTSVAFSPDGRSLISGSADGTVRVWSIEEETTSSRHAARLLRVSPDGEWEVRQLKFGLSVVVAHRSGETWRPIENDLTLSVAEFSADGRHVALGFENGAVHVGTLPASTATPPTATPVSPTPPAFVRAHATFAGDIQNVRFGPDGEWLAISSADGQVTIVSSRDGAVLASLRRADQSRHDLEPTTRALDIAASGRELIVGRADGSVELWSRESTVPHAPWTLVQRWFLNRGPCSAAFFTSAGDEIVALFGTHRDQRRQVVTWITDTDLPLVRSLGTYPAWNLIPNPERDRFFVSLSDPARVLVISPRHEDPLLTISGHLAQTYHFAGFVGRSSLQVYDLQGKRVELRTIDPNTEREQYMDTLRERADNLLSEDLCIERAVLRLRKDRKLPDWAREYSYFRVMARGDTFAQCCSDLLTRALEPRSTWSEHARPLEHAKALAEFAPTDPEALRLLALVHYRADRPEQALVALDAIAQTEHTPTGNALRALTLSKLGREDQARIQFLEVRKSLQESVSAMLELHPQLMRELNETFGGP